MVSKGACISFVTGAVVRVEVAIKLLLSCCRCSGSCSWSMRGCDRSVSNSISWNEFRFRMNVGKVPAGESCFVVTGGNWEGVKRGVSCWVVVPAARRGEESVFKRWGLWGERKMCGGFSVVVVVAGSGLGARFEGDMVTVVAGGIPVGLAVVVKVRVVVSGSLTVVVAVVVDVVVVVAAVTVETFRDGSIPDNCSAIFFERALSIWVQ